jgi:hypothetical protein
MGAVSELAALGHIDVWRSFIVVMEYGAGFRFFLFLELIHTHARIYIYTQYTFMILELYMF